MAKVTVGIAGCGGLGSNCAAALARVRTGHLVLADFDRVEESNLNRQYFFRDQIGIPKVEALAENLKRINPEVSLSLHNCIVDKNNIKDLYQDCDIIVEAFDRAEMKHMLVETILELMPDKFIVTATGLAGWGRSNDLKVRRTGRLYICGDGVSETTDAEPPLAPRVAITANMQANTVLEIILESNTRDNRFNSGID